MSLPSGVEITSDKLVNSNFRVPSTATTQEKKKKIFFFFFLVRQGKDIINILVVLPVLKIHRSDVIIDLKVIQMPDFQWLINNC